MLKEKILAKQAGIVTYGLTPPKRDNAPEKIAAIAAKQRERIQNLAIDGLILYDIQEESDRIQTERPFPFLPTIDPREYRRDYLGDLHRPVIIYQCVGKYSRQQFHDWLATEAQDGFAVFVGASSRRQEVGVHLPEAYELKRQISPNLILGGVAIPERHIGRDDEHLRIVHKTASGCQFFVSQAVYNLEAAKNFLSDYYYHCQQHRLEMAPILFTLTPCGSLKTLDFMKWLGISVPKWLENELANCADVLDKSLTLITKIFRELLEFAAEKGIPLGCNIESVSVRKVEIEASIQLVNEIRRMIDQAWIK